METSQTGEVIEVPIPDIANLVLGYLNNGLSAFKDVELTDELTDKIKALLFANAPDAHEMAHEEVEF